jgi:hypothetical protein
MSPRRFSQLRLWLPATALAAAAACHAPAPRVSPAAGAAAPHDTPDTRAAADPSYDWHVLLIAPFGSVLKEVPATLHEVLLFRDDAHAAADDGECYAPDTPAPRFVGRAPDEYLLCFKQDRLARIHASVYLSDADAAEVFAAACSSWLRHVAPAAAVPAAAGSAQGTDVCEGSAGDIHFSAHLGEESALSIVLESVSDP